MDLSELPSMSERRAASLNPLAAPAQAQEWRELVAQIGRETAAPLNDAIERVNAFATTGKIDRAGLRTIREAMDRARRIGMMAQQISRFASGRVQASPERLNLTQVVQDALAQRVRETKSRGIELQATLAHAEVIVDAALLSALLQAMLDWSLEHARSHITIKLDVKTWPDHARLACQFFHVLPDRLGASATAHAGRPTHDVACKLDTMPWQLLRSLAHAAGLLLQRDDSAGETRLTVEFPRTAADALISLSGLDEDAPDAAGHNSQPMAGSHVLVITARRETRVAVRGAARSTGMMVDFVASVEEAREFCSASLPHAVIYEAAVAGAKFQQLRAEWTAQAPTLVLIEIEEDGRSHAISDQGGFKTSRIGRDGLVNLLPRALLAVQKQAE